MTTVIVTLTALICVLLMFVILIQNPKGGGVDTTYGGQAANQMLGAAKSSVIAEKVTWGLTGAVFFLCIIATLLVGV